MLVIPNPERVESVLSELRPAETQVLLAVILLSREIGGLPLVTTLGAIMTASGLSKPTVNRCTHSLARAKVLNVWDRGMGPGATMKIRVNPVYMATIEIDSLDFQEDLKKKSRHFWSERAVIYRRDKP